MGDHRRHCHRSGDPAIRIPATLSLSDAIREATTRLEQSGVVIGHHADNALDEARALVLHALHLPEVLPAAYADTRLLPSELRSIRRLLDRRIGERIPAAYLIGHASFAGLRLRTDARALVPRSPIAELIPGGFRPWLDGVRVQRALDVCTGGGSIAVAMAVHQPGWQVDALDLSTDALALAAENVELHRVAGRVRLLHSDLLAALGADDVYQLIVSNPPYLTDAEFAALPAEYGHEPALALPSGADGLDLTLNLLRDAPAHLSADGVLIVEIGEAEAALRRLLPRLDLEVDWIPFRVGPMGVFVVLAGALRAAHEGLVALCRERAGP